VCVCAQVDMRVQIRFTGMSDTCPYWWISCLSAARWKSHCRKVNFYVQSFPPAI